MPIEKLKKHEIFKLLRSEQIDRLSDGAQVLTFEKGKLIYPRGARTNYFYIMLKGQVALRLPGKGGMNILIDQLAEGDMFGGCISFAIDSYTLNAQCVEDSEILALETSVLKSLMDDDSRIGYIIQSKISEIYFLRYVETMKKLQSIVMNIPIEGE